MRMIKRHRFSGKTTPDGYLAFVSEAVVDTLASAAPHCRTCQDSAKVAYAIRQDKIRPRAALLCCRLTDDYGTTVWASHVGYVCGRWKAGGRWKVTTGQRPRSGAHAAKV